jgi:NADPH2:quinone reductase
VQRVKARAIQIREHGGPEVLQLVELEIGDPGPGEVRVRHHAIGVNYIDTYHRSGLYPVPMPCVLGTEGAGIVDAVGAGVTHLAAGDRVAYAARTPGSYAEARLVGATQVCKLPDTIGFETAAAMMLKGMTVQYLLRQTLPHAGLQPGDEIVWHAAAGGVGQIACQWAKAIGLVVIGTAGGPAKCELANKAGAAHVIDYHAEDVVARVMAITKGRGVKVVYDGVGKDTWQRSIDCLQPLGLMVSFGNASGPVPPISLGSLTAKSLYVTRPTLGTHTATRESTQAIADDLFAMVASGKISVAVEQKYPLAEAARAHRELEAKKTIGASVLVP